MQKEGGCRRSGSLQPRSAASLLAGEAGPAQVLLAGPVLLPSVGELAAAAETPETTATTLPCCLPHASRSFRGALLPICSSFLDTWPFCFCLVTTEGTFQLPRNVLEEEK